MRKATFLKLLLYVSANSNPLSDLNFYDFLALFFFTITRIIIRTAAAARIPIQTASGVVSPVLTSAVDAFAEAGELSGEDAEGFVSGFDPGFVSGSVPGFVSGSVSGFVSGSVSGFVSDSVSLSFTMMVPLMIGVDGFSA